MRLLNVVDEFTRECLTIEVARRFTGKKVVEVLKELFAIRRCPKFIRSDNGPEFACKAVKNWLKDSGVGPLFIEPGSPSASATPNPSEHTKENVNQTLTEVGT